jgi:hypothetical protein
VDESSIFDDDGRYLGQQVEVEGGGFALVSDGGEILSAVDADMNPVDVSEFELAGSELPGAAFEERIAALESRPPPQPVQYQPPVLPDPEQQLAALELVAADLGRQRGHALTLGERRALADRALEVANATGGELDIAAAAWDLMGQGRGPLIDTSTTEGKAAWASARVADETDGSDPQTGQPAWTEPVDSSDSARRVAKAINSFNGHDTSDASDFGGDGEGME